MSAPAGRDPNEPSRNWGGISNKFDLNQKIEIQKSQNINETISPIKKIGSLQGRKVEQINDNSMNRVFSRMGGDSPFSAAHPLPNKIGGASEKLAAFAQQRQDLRKAQIEERKEQEPEIQKEGAQGQDDFGQMGRLKENPSPEGQSPSQIEQEPGEPQIEEDDEPEPGAAPIDVGEVDIEEREGPPHIEAREEPRLDQLSNEQLIDLLSLDVNQYPPPGFVSNLVRAQLNRDPENIRDLSDFLRLIVNPKDIIEIFKVKDGDSPLIRMRTDALKEDANALLRCGGGDIGDKLGFTPEQIIEYRIGKRDLY